MFNIIVLLIAGSALTYISKFNMQVVDVNLGIYLFRSIPLFYVIVGSLLVGLILSYVMQLLTNVLTYLEIRGKSQQIKSSQIKIMDLTKTVHKLELANEKLKHSEPEVGDPNGL